MGKINILGFDVANLIAAGEVVDRPASVVKELLENALDAGATSITVEIKNGGVSFIRIADNGCGMDADDLPVAVLRHATSKIRAAEDLETIGTLGFRGEALAAISSVSRMRIFSRVPGAEFGALMECDGGSVVSVTETGCAPGTTVIVEELFFNVPARRKFLKKDSTETVAVTGVVEKIALSNPRVSVKYIADGEVRFMTAGDGELRNTIYALFGRDTAARTIAVDREEGGIRVSGFISEPDTVRSNRNMENFFINGRYVKSRTAMAALEQAYTSRIPSEKFPFCVLNITLNPAAVDVNVHPAKLEVNFSNEKIIFEAVYYAVLGALESAGSRPELTIRRESAQPRPQPSTMASSGNKAVQAAKSTAAKPNFWISDAEARRLFGAFVPSGGDRPPNTVRDQVKIAAPGARAAAPSQTVPPSAPENLPSRAPSAVQVSPVEEHIPSAVQVPPVEQVPPAVPEKPAVQDMPVESSAPEEKKPAIPDYVIVGEAFNCYIIVQLEDRLMLIDKHAAHERILFDQLCENLHSRAKTAQMLMFPIEITMTEAEVHALEEERERIEALGFLFSRVPGGVSVSGIPTEIAREAAPDMLCTLAGRLASGEGSIESTETEFFEARLYQAACKAAIKGGRVYSMENIRWLCDRILCVPEKGGSAVKTCPHGRPVAFEIRKNSIERQFARLV